MEWHSKWVGAFILAVSCALSITLSADVGISFKKQQIELSFKNKKKKISVEVAESITQHAYGLMNRKKLPTNSGMLFVFSDEKIREFWMKNTLIDLDIAYINKDMIIIDIQQMKAATSLMQTNLPTYPSKSPAQYALEMNAGWFKKNKLEVGTSIKIISGPTSK